jgi:beta-N-acetylhexosaminidase
MREAYDGLLEAVNSGRIPQERLDASVRRIIRMKLASGK